MPDENNPLDEDLLKELGLDPDELAKPMVRPSMSTAAQRTVDARTSESPPAPAAAAPKSSLPPGARPRIPASAGPAGPLNQAAAQNPALRRPTGDVSLPPNAVPAPRPSQPAPTVANAPSPEKFVDNLKSMADDMPLQVVAVLGKKTMTLKEVVELQHDSVIDLKKTPNDTVDLVANGKLVARGSLVLIDGKVGVQIKQLIGS